MKYASNEKDCAEDYLKDLEGCIKNNGTWLHVDVIASHGGSEVNYLGLGKVADRIMHTATVPVLRGRGG